MPSKSKKESVGLGIRDYERFYSTGGNIFHCIFLFSRSNASDANSSIIANFD